MISDDEWNRNFRNSMKNKRPKTTDEELDLLGSSSSYWESENYRSAAAWCATSWDLIADSTQSSNSIIFVNLHGLLDEIPKFLKDKAKIFSRFDITDDDAANAFIATSTDDIIKNRFQLLWDSNRTSAKIRELCSDDDLFVLGFLRHRYSHPILSGYSVKIEGPLGDSKFKVANWKKLKNLGSNTKEEEFKLRMIKKLLPVKPDIKTLVLQLQKLAN